MQTFPKTKFEIQHTLSVNSVPLVHKYDVFFSKWMPLLVRHTKESIFYFSLKDATHTSTFKKKKNAFFFS